MPASAGDAAQRAYEAVTMHLSLARSCGADAYERAKSEAQETLDAGGYTQGTAADLIAMIEATAAVSFPASYCRDELQDIEWNLPALREDLARSG